MAVTLDGIAKGFIVDAGTAVLKGLGYGNVFVEAGGDLMASGTKENDLPWKVGIRSPRGVQGEILAKLNLTNQAAATSGDYFQYFTPDLENHHIIDPRIGRSAPELASASVVSDSAMLSDALATALMVMGPEAGLSLIETIPGVEAYLISKDLKVWKSTGLGEI